VPRILTPAEFRSQPWKNGGGVTHEIVRWPDTTRSLGRPLQPGPNRLQRECDAHAEDVGPAAQALEDVKLLLRVNDCVREQPFLISHLVRIAIMSIALQPIYEGLAQHSWSDAQLAELEQVLSRQDYLADYEFAMRGEKATAIDTLPTVTP
jgi:hypothetical protein